MYYKVKSHLDNMINKTVIIIPARWGSTRLPGKPLIPIFDKPMIQWVYEECKKSDADEVYVATDDQRIHRKVIAFGGKSILTGECHTGTDRILEASSELTFDILLNIQGDEPCITYREINTLIHLAKKNPEYISTLSSGLQEDELSNRNVVKLIKGGKHVAMFTRSSLYLKTPNIEKHIGVYAFPKGVLNKISKLKGQSQNELVESLEQLRWADAGIKFVCGTVFHKAKGVDTPEDIQAAENYLKLNRK
jgi:3-deoxy-manno-octulosonate cytidylyltransferase (CMP-KDO synthetase)